MRALVVLTVALAGVLGAATVAHASCPLALDGDAELVEQLRGELASFDDDGSPCVALSVRCWRTGDQLEVAVSDADGRTAQRAFASTRGAAAFIMSWSLHPPMDLAKGQRAAITAPSADRSWHPEIALAYLDTPGADHGGWGTLSASLDRRIGYLRFGGGLRGLSGHHPDVASVDAELRVGVVWDGPARWSLRTELAGAKTLFVVGSTASPFPEMTSYAAEGLRSSTRTLLAWQLDGPLGIEIGAGYDWLRTISPGDRGILGHGPAVGFWRFDVGLRWVP